MEVLSFPDHLSGSDNVHYESQTLSFSLSATHFYILNAFLVTLLAQY